MKIKSVIASIIILITSNITFSQANDTPPCSSPEASQFDFWIGEWNLTWKSAEGKEQTGSNTITKSLSGCVIEEHFDGNPSMPFIGKSFSVYNPQKNTWQQTIFLQQADNVGKRRELAAAGQHRRVTLHQKVLHLFFHIFLGTGFTGRFQRLDDAGRVQKQRCQGYWPP